MPRYKLMVFTQPVEGREDEYNDWYRDTHLQDLVDIPGVRSAERFRLAQQVSDRPVHPYLAIYEIEADDVSSVIEEIKRRSASGQMFITPALSRDVYAGAYEPMNESARA